MPTMQRCRWTNPENETELLIRFKLLIRNNIRAWIIRKITFGLKMVEMVENAAQSVFFDPGTYTAKHTQAFA